MASADYKQQAKNALSGHWGEAVVTTLLAAVLGSTVVNYNSEYGMVISWLNNHSDSLFNGGTPTWDEGWASFGQTTFIFAAILVAISLLVGGLMNLGITDYFQRLNYQQRAPMGVLFSHVSQYKEAFLANLLVIVYIALWSILLVIPGIVAAYSYSMTFFIMQENPGMSATEAIKASKQLMRGHKLELFWLELSFLGWAILSMLTFGIGYFFLNPYFVATKTAYYDSIRVLDRKERDEFDENETFYVDVSDDEAEDEEADVNEAEYEEVNV